MAETKVEEKVEEAAKIDLFEDDDEFEEFEIGLGIPLPSFSPNFLNIHYSVKSHFVYILILIATVSNINFRIENSY